MVHRNSIQRRSFPVPKDILPRTFELFQHCIQTAQGDGLLAPFQSENGGRWKPNLLGKLGKRHVSPLSFQEFGQLFVQW